MRLLFASLASYGHIYPLLPLAIAAREAGHDVVFATGEQFLPSLRKAGLEVAVAGLPFREVFSRLQTGGERPSSPEKLTGLIITAFGDVLPRQVVEDLGAVLTAARPDLVVHEVGNAGSALAAKIASIPAVCHGFGRASRTPMLAAMDGPFRSFAAELGVDLPGEYPYTLGNPYLDICPPSLQAAEFKAAVDRIELRPVAWNEPGELPVRVVLDRCRPLVYLTLGTEFGNVDVLRQAIGGLSRLPVDVLVSTGPEKQLTALGDVPGNVRVKAWVPQADLLPHVDLVVHHGGSGTTLGALAAGLPQLFLPQGADQFANAETVLETGAGGRVLPEEFNADVVAEQARKLLVDGSVTAAARRLSAEIAGMPSPADVVQRLPELAR